MDLQQRRLLEKQADVLSNRLLGWEMSIVKRIGKRVKAIGGMSVADVQQLNNMATARQDFDAIVKELASVTNQNIVDVEKMYSDALESADLANKPLYDYRDKAFVPIADNMELQAIVRAYAKVTAGNMINMSNTKALGFILDGEFKQLQNTIYDALSKASYQVATGSAGFGQVMRDTIVELGGSRVRVNYGSGVTRGLDVVVRQNVLWGAKQVYNEYNNVIGEYLGCDGFEVDWHSNPRPSHDFMQGIQFAYEGSPTIKGKKYPNGKEALERLQDYGCLHFKTDIILGVSEPTFSKKELKKLNDENNKPIEIDGITKSGYEWKQTMRALERATRSERIKKAGFEGLNSREDIQSCNRKIKGYEDKYNKIADATGIKAQHERMAIVSVRR